jgi:BirA family biotin operon repressor/biotin-[acetyl-CoA-carboxylase] ligase
VDTTVSTNADVVAAARGGAAAGLVVAAERQTGGRGRQAREWVSPPQAGLTFSVLLRPSVPVTRWGWLPLLAGLALARAVGRLGAVPVRLKWPNDLLLGPERGKAAGLLAEVTGAAVVVGVGLNVSTRRGELPHGATSLAVEAAACTDRMPLLIATLRDIAADYERWQAAGGDPEASGLRAGYLAICDTVGRAVAVSIPGGRTMTGEAVDVDGDGRLVVQDPAGLRTPLAAGDVLHVRPTTAP